MLVGVAILLLLVVAVVLFECSLRRPTRDGDGMRLYRPHARLFDAVLRDEWWTATKHRRPFRPPCWLRNGHVQTLLVARQNRATTFDGVTYRRELVVLEDGGTISLDWSESHGTVEDHSEDDTPTLVFLHGLTGGSHEWYIKSVIENASSRYRWRSVVFNARGCAGVALSSSQLFCAAYTDDLRAALRRIREVFPKAPLIAVGFSLGSNILVKYLGEEGDRTPLLGAVSVGNPFDLMHSNHALESRWLYRRFYSRALCDHLKELFGQHSHRFANSTTISVDDVMASETVREFDDRLTRRVFGYRTVHDYYRDASSCRFVHNVAVPLLCLNALDDPISVAGSIPYDECRGNPFVTLLTTDHGGHLGWFAGSTGRGSWASSVVVDYAAALFNALRSGTLEPVLEDVRREHFPVPVAFERYHPDRGTSLHVSQSLSDPEYNSAGSNLKLLDAEDESDRSTVTGGVSDMPVDTEWLSAAQLFASAGVVAACTIFSSSS